MSGIYEKPYTLTSSDVNRARRLRTSVMMRWLQEAAIAHTEALGMGREKTLDRGILWILGMQRAEISRMPVYDEKILVRSWPGKTMHLFFPRYYELVSADGSEILVRASALWMLLDQETRRFAFPEHYGIEIEGTETGREIRLPSSPKLIEADHEEYYTVPFSYVDLNGHMNNTRYFDLADDRLPFEKEGRLLSSLAVEYLHEVREGEDVLLRFGTDGAVGVMTGEGAQPSFRLRLEYTEE